MTYTRHVATQGSLYTGKPMHYFGSITIYSDESRTKKEYVVEAEQVIQKTMDCFQDGIRKELERIGRLDDDEFCTEVHAGFCEYMRYIFNHGWLREWRRNPEDYGKIE